MANSVALLILLITSLVFAKGPKPYVRLPKDLPHVANMPWWIVGTMPYNCQFQPCAG